MKQKTCAEILAEIGEKIDKSPVLKAACIYSDSVKKPSTIYGYGKVGLIEAFKSGAEWQAKQAPWIKAKDRLPDVDENNISEQSEPVLVIVAAKGHYEPEILVYNKYYHVWDTADTDDYSCKISDDDLWMPIPKFNS